MQTAAQLRAEGIEVEAVAADIARGPDAARLIAAAKARFGHIDVLVNNAGVSMRGLFSELVPEVIETVVRTNITRSRGPDGGGAGRTA